MLSRYFHTMRHLRPVQIVTRPIHALRRSLMPAPTLEGYEPGAYPGCAWPAELNFEGRPYQQAGGARLKNGVLEFLQKAEDVGWPPDWNFCSGSSLWDYHLFYFDYLWSLDYKDARKLVSKWVVHDSFRRTLAWDAYPVSLRLTNLCAYFFGAHRRETEKDSSFLQRLWPLIALHADWLASHFEFHLLGNHLLENAAALAFAGTCFDGGKAEKWRKKGLKVLHRQISEQILPDGMHFERSTMYHQRILQVLLWLDRTKLDDMEAACRLMSDALQKLCHPDGSIALLNDSTVDQYGSPGDVLGEGDAVSGCFALPDAGYYGWRGDDGDYIVCDAGDLGPDYIPGHAHADMLSFELSLRGHRVIVDSGVCEYSPGERRDYSRSSEAHNTIEINRKDQAECWASFRVARRGHIRDVEWSPAAGGFRLMAWHDGYQRLAGKPVHKRSFSWDAPRTLRIVDEIESATPVRVASRLHLHPDCHVEKISDSSAVVRYPGGALNIAFTGEGSLAKEDGFYSPRFGDWLEQTVLVFRAAGSEMHLGINIGEVE